MTIKIKIVGLKPFYHLRFVVRSESYRNHYLDADSEQSFTKKTEKEKVPYNFVRHFIIVYICGTYKGVCEEVTWNPRDILLFFLVLSRGIRARTIRAFSSSPDR